MVNGKSMPLIILLLNNNLLKLKYREIQELCIISICMEHTDDQAAYTQIQNILLFQIILFIKIYFSLSHTVDTWLW